MSSIQRTFEREYWGKLDLTLTADRKGYVLKHTQWLWEAYQEGA